MPAATTELRLAAILAGIDREPPYPSCLRLLPALLIGHRLVAFSENTATIEMRTGERHIRRRKPAGPGRIWHGS